MGRVGSVSVRKALHQKGVMAHHVHHLFCSNGEPGFGGPRWDELSTNVLDLTKTIKIITLIRDPVYRSLSSWLIQKKVPEMESWSLEQARQIFLREQRLKYTLSWFDKELSVLLGLDSLALLRSKPLKHKKHYRFVRDQYDVLVLRTSHLDKKAPVLSDFVGRNIEMVRHNVSANRPGFADQYSRLVEGISFSEELVKEVYSSKLVKAAFTDHEINEMESNWI